VYDNLLCAIQTRGHARAATATPPLALSRTCIIIIYKHVTRFSCRLGSSAGLNRITRLQYYKTRADDGDVRAARYSRTRETRASCFGRTIVAYNVITMVTIIATRACSSLIVFIFLRNVLFCRRRRRRGTTRARRGTNSSGASCASGPVYSLLLL